MINKGISFASIIGSAFVWLLMTGCSGNRQNQETDDLKTPDASGAVTDTLDRLFTVVNVEYAPENIERGRYLSNHVYVCFECHTERDWELFSGPGIDSVFGAGGAKMNENVHPGLFYTSNITPAGLSDWTDAEIFRAIVCGLNKDNKPLYGGMPFSKYNSMPQQDVEDIIAYLRSLEPIGRKTPASVPNEDVKETLMENVMDYYPDSAYTAPDRSDEVAYGEYLFDIASCGGCHSHVENKMYYPSSGPAGGYAFNIFDRKDTVRGANITPDSTTGIGRWTKTRFIEKFKYFATEEGRSIPSPEGTFCTAMPWTDYAGMTEEDLGAIYAYLRSLEPVEHKVELYTKYK